MLEEAAEIPVLSGGGQTMKPLITADEKRKLFEMLDRGLSRQTISNETGLTLGQISAFIAHRTMRAKQNNEAVRSDQARPITLATRSRESSDDNTSELSVSLGVDQSKSIVKWYPVHASNPHLLIVGESGSGKTYAVSRFAIELANQNVPSIIFDYGQGFSLTQEASDLAENITLETLDLGAKGISINPLQIFPTDLLGPLSVAQRVADTFVRVYPRLGVQQHALLRRAATDVFKDAGITVEDKESWRRGTPPFRL